MKHSRILYGAALAVTGLGSLALQAWVWSQGGVSWYHGGGHHGDSGPMGSMGLGMVFLVVVILLALGWYRHRHRVVRLDPRGDLAMEYVEGRITQEEFLARRAVLEEQ